MNSPLISVCIPAYNAELTIVDAIESVLNQSVADFELIVVDNASTDRTAEVVAAIADSRVRLVKNGSNIGYPANVNRCLDLAAGEFITLICADDYLLNRDVLKLWIDALADKNNCVAAHSSFTHPRHGAVTDKRAKAHSILKEGMNSSSEVVDAFLSGRGFFGWGWLFRTSVVNDRKIRFNESLTMAPDTLFWLELSMQGDVYETPFDAPAYAFVIHENSLGTRLFSDFAGKVFKELLDFELALKQRMYKYNLGNVIAESYVPARYTCNECVCILKNNYLNGNIGQSRFWRESLKLIRLYPAACSNSRFVKNFVLGSLPRQFANYLRRGFA